MGIPLPCPFFFFFKFPCEFKERDYLVNCWFILIGDDGLYLRTIIVWKRWGLWPLERRGYVLLEKSHLLSTCMPKIPCGPHLANLSESIIEQDPWYIVTNPIWLKCWTNCVLILHGKNLSGLLVWDIFGSLQYHHRKGEHWCSGDGARCCYCQLCYTWILLLVLNAAQQLSVIPYILSRLYIKIPFSINCQETVVLKTRLSGNGYTAIMSSNVTFYKFHWH